MTFWTVLAVIGAVEVAASLVFAWHSRKHGRKDRYDRAVRAIYTFTAWTLLCVIRIVLLRGGS